MKKGWRCPLGQTFFGLTDKYIEAVYGGWSLMEAYNLPVGLRQWFLKRLEKQFKDEAQQMKKASGKR